MGWFDRAPEPVKTSILASLKVPITPSWTDYDRSLAYVYGIDLGEFPVPDVTLESD